ncbi:hypothetical protein TNCV_429991 [Trichonephila clavipes]|nr:hypothetical protein TNCV_429991 [Trichonephila clavipes]
MLTESEAFKIRLSCIITVPSRTSRAIPSRVYLSANGFLYRYRVLSEPTSQRKSKQLKDVTGDKNLPSTISFLKKNVTEQEDATSSLEHIVSCALIRQQVYAWEKMKKGGRERPSGHWLLWLLAPTKAIGSLVGQIYDVYQGHQVSELMGQDRYDQMMMFDRSCFLL